MGYITAYTAVSDPILGKLPVHQSIQSLYDHVDAFVVYDCSKYDNIDLSMYGKVRKHVRGVWNPFDSPFGALFTSALRLVDSDIALFLDIDEIFEFKQVGLKELVTKFPLETGAGIAFSLLNYYCDRHHVLDGCSSKGAHVFKMRDDLYHDMISGYSVFHSRLRRTSYSPDSIDGVRLVDGNGVPMPHWQPIPPEAAVIHHTSHLDPISKMVRSVLQINHTSTLDLPEFYPYDMRVTQDVIRKIYDFGTKEINDKEFVLYKEALPFNYISNVLLEDYIRESGILEFDPTGFPFIKDPFTGNVPPPGQPAE